MTALRIGDRGEAVLELQHALTCLGLPVAPDGTLGPGTEQALRAYQARSGLDADGVCGPDTRSSIAIDCSLCARPDWRAYRGSLGVLVREEGFDGEAHWPGGASGVTLDRGFDLRWQPENRLRALYGHLWTESGVAHLATACGLAGTRAEHWLQHARAAGWRWPITREQADAILPRAALPYWHECLRVWPELEHLPAPWQTAALSVCYSAWSAPLREARRDPEQAPHVIRQAPGDPRRRAREASLIAMGRDPL